MTTETNVERFKRISKTDRYMYDRSGRYVTVSSYDFDWLIQQAEQAQELEKSIKALSFVVEVYSELPVEEAMKQLINIVQEDSQ